MPVIGIPVRMLLDRLGTALGRDELVEHLQHLGCDVEGYVTMRRFRCQLCDNIQEITQTENPPVVCDYCGVDFKQRPALLEELGQSDVIRMELLAVRPDMFDPGGLARVLRDYLGESDQQSHYKLSHAHYRVSVSSELANAESFRPKIACAFFRNIDLNEDLIKVIMKLQENLHWALGRDRKRASIGMYDASGLQGPELRYTTVGPDELRFAPLGFDPNAEADRLTPREILERHPKGIAYARLLAGFTRYPLLCDSSGQVLSMPPIINSEQTRVKRSTRDLFIDVTGAEERIVNKTLNIIVTSLAELAPGATIEQVLIDYGDHQTVTPDLTFQKMVIDCAQAASTIGVNLSQQEIIKYLRKMGHAVSQAEGSNATVMIPAYRNDIMHPVDLIEDIAIAYGYHNIEPTVVETLTLGAEQDIDRQARACRAALTGLGYMEVLTLILSSEEAQYDALQLPRGDDYAQLANPISVEQTMIRTSLIPGLLSTFSANTDHEYPQRIFEIGNITLLAPESETGAKESLRVAGGSIGPRADYAEIRAACEAMLREFGWKLEARPSDLSCFIAGRAADVVAYRGAHRVVVGRMGEVHPQVLENFNLIQPAAVFELDIASLIWEQADGLSGSKPE